MSNEGNITYRTDINGSIIIEERDDEDSNISLTETFDEEDKEVELIIKGVEALTTGKIDRDTAIYFSKDRKTYFEKKSSSYNLALIGKESFIGKIRDGIVNFVMAIINFCKKIYNWIMDKFLTFIGRKRPKQQSAAITAMKHLIIKQFIEIVNLLKDEFPNQNYLPSLDDYLKDVPDGLTRGEIYDFLAAKFLKQDPNLVIKWLNELTSKDIPEIINEARKSLNHTDILNKEINRRINDLEYKLKRNDLYVNDFLELGEFISRSANVPSDIAPLYEKFANFIKKLTDVDFVKTDDKNIIKDYINNLETTLASKQSIKTLLDFPNNQLGQNEFMKNIIYKGITQNYAPVEKDNKITGFVKDVTNLNDTLTRSERQLLILQTVGKQAIANNLIAPQALGDIEQNFIMFFQKQQEISKLLKIFISTITGVELSVTSLLNWYVKFSDWLVINMNKDIKTLIKEIEIFLSNTVGVRQIKNDLAPIVNDQGLTPIEKRDMIINVLKSKNYPNYSLPLDVLLNALRNTPINSLEDLINVLDRNLYYQAAEPVFPPTANENAMIVVKSMLDALRINTDKWSKNFSNTMLKI